jgi:hypothetical protein
MIHFDSFEARALNGPCDARLVWFGLVWLSLVWLSLVWLSLT